MFQDACECNRSLGLDVEGYYDDYIASALIVEPLRFCMVERSMPYI